MKYVCPLCKQPVSLSLYRKITVIWEDYEKLHKQLKLEKEKLAKKLRLERKKLQKQLREQMAKFKEQKTQLVKQAVEQKTKHLEKKLETLKLREQRAEKQLKLKAKQAEKRANTRIQQAIRQEHARAEKLARIRFDKWKKEMRTEVKERIKQERRLAAEAEKERMRRAKNSAENALRQLQIKSGRLNEANKQIKELRKQLEKQTTPQREGLLYECTLASELNKKFPTDKILHTGKGGDVLHTVVLNGEPVGLIVYECKRVTKYKPIFVEQAAKAKVTRKADFSILVTSAMKRKTQGFFVEKEVLVVHPTGVIALASIIREQIVQIAAMKLGQQQKDKAIRLVLQYIEGPEFSNSMDIIVQESIAVYKDLFDEKKEHEKTWEKREEAYKKICHQAITVKSTSRTLLAGDEAKPAISENVLQSIAAPLPEKEKTPVRFPPPISVAVPVKRKRGKIPLYHSPDDAVAQSEA